MRILKFNLYFCLFVRLELFIDQFIKITFLTKTALIKYFVSSEKCVYI